MEVCRTVRENKHSHIQAYFFLSHQITQAEVDQFKPKLTIPSCMMELQWTGGEQVPPQPLRHRVTLLGTKPSAFFYI